MVQPLGARAPGASLPSHEATSAHTSAAGLPAVALHRGSPVFGSALMFTRREHAGFKQSWRTQTLAHA